MRKSTGTLVLAGVIASLGMTGAASPPDVFSDMKFKDAKAKSIETKKLFIVDATASWCGPCKMMDKTTWIDEDVVSWINEHAIAIQLDVDEEKMGAKMLKISAMPTIIVFKEGKEFDRVVGYQDTHQILDWLDGVSEGRRAIDKLREKAGDRMDPEGNVDIDARYDLAGTLMLNGELDEATEEYVWLWKNMLQYEPSMSSVRVSFMAGKMEELARRHIPAKLAFQDLRDSYLEAIEDPKADRDVKVDWITLNASLGQQSKTLEWFDRHCSGLLSHEHFKWVEMKLLDLLIESGRWSEGIHALEDPVEFFRQQERFYDMDRNIPQLTEAENKEIREITQRHFREKGAKLYAVCLSAELPDEAGEISDLLLEKQDNASARILLVKTALKAGQPRKKHIQWLDEAAEQGKKSDSLRRKLERALAEKD